MKPPRAIVTRRTLLRYLGMPMGSADSLGIAWRKKGDGLSDKDIERALERVHLVWGRRLLGVRRTRPKRLYGQWH